MWIIVHVQMEILVSMVVHVLVMEGVHVLAGGIARPDHQRAIHVPFMMVMKTGVIIRLAGLIVVASARLAIRVLGVVGVARR